MFRDVTGARRVTVPFCQIRENKVAKWQRDRQCALLGFIDPAFKYFKKNQQESKSTGPNNPSHPLFVEHVKHKVDHHLILKTQHFTDPLTDPGLHCVH